MGWTRDWRSTRPRRTSSTCSGRSCRRRRTPCSRPAPSSASCSRTLERAHRHPDLRHARQSPAAMTSDAQVERLEALVAEQSALRRVATLVASDPEPRALFDAVCEELARVLGVDITDMVSYEGDGSAIFLGTPVSR